MAQPPPQTDLSASSSAPCRCYFEDSCPPVHYLLLPEFCLDNWRQRDCFSLADHDLQFHSLQSWYVQSLLTVFLSEQEVDSYPLSGFFYFAPIIGAVIGAVVGHWLHDIVGKYYMRRHSSHTEPEARLIVIWLASPIMTVSILVLGFALQHTYHYMVIAVFFAGQVMGIMVATVALNAYLLDAYPEGSGEVGAWIVMGRTMGGFVATYIEIDWVTKSGALDALGAQTGITAAAGFIILAQGLFGKRIRMAQGRMKFAMESGY